MSESSGERAFDPTPSRLARARREGDAPRAHELAANAAFLGGIAAVLAIVAPIAGCARAALSMAASGGMPITATCTLLAYAVTPFAAAALCGAAASLLQQGGIHVVAPSLKFERLAPTAGMKRMFSRDTVGQSIRAAAAFAVAAGMVCSSVTAVLAIHTMEVQVVAAIAWERARIVLALCAAFGLAFGVVEFGAARRSWLRRMRMTLDELRRDMKEQDGDPRARARRKAAHRALLRGSLSRVKDASFVVVNPTHVAIALAYDPPAIPVPEVLVRATDELALRVREIAREHDIPIVEHVPLARALLRDGDVGRPIPVEHYVAVAEVVAALSARNPRVTRRQ